MQRGVVPEADVQGVAVLLGGKQLHIGHNFPFELAHADNAPVCKLPDRGFALSPSDRQRQSALFGWLPGLAPASSPAGGGHNRTALEGFWPVANCQVLFAEMLVGAGVQR